MSHPPAQSSIRLLPWLDTALDLSRSMTDEAIARELKKRYPHLEVTGEEITIFLEDVAHGRLSTQ